MTLVPLVEHLTEALIDKLEERFSDHLQNKAELIIADLIKGESARPTSGMM